MCVCVRCMSVGACQCTKECKKTRLGDGRRVIWLRISRGKNHKSIFKKFKMEDNLSFLLPVCNRFALPTIFLATEKRAITTSTAVACRRAIFDTKIENNPNTNNAKAHVDISVMPSTKHYTLCVVSFKTDFIVAIIMRIMILCFTVFYTGKSTARGNELQFRSDLCWKRHMILQLVTSQLCARVLNVCAY